MIIEEFEREVRLTDTETKIFCVKIVLYRVNMLTRLSNSNGLLMSVYGKKTRPYVVGLIAKQESLTGVSCKIIPSEEDKKNLPRVFLRYNENLMVNKESYMKEVNRLLSRLDELVREKELQLYSLQEETVG